VAVFAGVSIELRRAEVLGVFGGNGCGKSTLLRSLLGLHAGCTGDVHRSPGRVGWVPQRVRESFFIWASLRENVRMTRPAGDAPRAKQLARIDAVAEELGVDFDLSLRPGEVSDGMLQQVAMLRALACEPSLLLADEPFAALDVEASRRLRAALRARVSRAALGAVVVLHDLDALLALADRVLVIEGRPFTLDPALSGHGLARLWVNHAASREEPRERGLASILRPLLSEREGG